MTTSATDFRHFRFFRPLTRRAAILAFRARHAATVRIPTFFFDTAAHDLVSFLETGLSEPARLHLKQPLKRAALIRSSRGGIGFLHSLRCALPAPTGVSPASATKQKQHHNDDQ